MGKAKDFTEILDNLAAALGDSQGQSLLDIQKDIEEEGFHYQQIMLRLRANVNSKLSQLKRSALDEARHQRLRTEKTFREKLTQFSVLSREQKLENLKGLLKGGFLSPAVAYRDLVKENDQDLDSLYEDAELARLIAEQRKQDE